MKISILLPYKENYSPEYAGAVSIFVNSTSELSIFKDNITIFGNTDFKDTLSKNYTNIPLTKNYLFKSQSKEYVNKFVKLHEDSKVSLIEIHNRPNYIFLMDKINSKLVLYFHNDPITMVGSKKISERITLLTLCEKIIFNSEWSKKRFLLNLSPIYIKWHKLEVIHQSINPKKVDINKKRKLITFAGKLNKAKGFDLFAIAIKKILNKHNDWKAIVIGDEPREKILVNHKNLKIIGFQKHNEVLKYFEKSSIAVACSRWEEPFGRTSLEASSRGCAVIISNRGGLPETITNGVIVRNLNAKNIYKSINDLIKNKKKREELQRSSLKNFYLTDQFITNKIDKYRISLKEFKQSTSKKF